MITPTMVAIFLFCLMGASFQAYRSGIKEGNLKGKVAGINASLDHLIESGRLQVSDKKEK
jgi:hypothetical protein